MCCNVLYVLCSLVVTCWERADLLAVVCVGFVTSRKVSWSTSESMVRFAPWNWFKPCSKIFYWPFKGGTSSVDLLWVFYVLCLLCLCASVYMCLAVTCWERADLFALVCGVQLWVCHFPIGILGQVWYLVVSIPDLCTLTYFVEILAQTTFKSRYPHFKKSHFLVWYKIFLRYVIHLYFN